MSALLDDTAYQAVRVLHADWDTFKDTAIARSLGVTSRSTLIAYHGGKEVGRVVAQTGKAEIEALFKAILD